MVHKAHLLCLIARGRLVDAACDDPLLQVLANILSK
jgi:xeroderma pigmentosum group C-complementing protein